MLGPKTKKLRPETRSKKVTIFYTESDDEETRQRALEICKRHNREPELVKLHKEHRVEDWKKINIEISKILKEDKKQ